MAGATRLELATSGVTGRRSNQTELRPHMFCKAIPIMIHRKYLRRLELAVSLSALTGCSDQTGPSLHVKFD